jgi:hypothetical protein
MTDKTSETEAADAKREAIMLPLSASVSIGTLVICFYAIINHPISPGGETFAGDMRLLAIGIGGGCSYFSVRTDLLAAIRRMGK